MAETKKNHYIDFIAGSVAGSTCKLFEYPMDTIKVLQQTTFKGMNAFKCFTETVRKNGARSLYNGLLTPLLSCTLETAFLFYAYEKSKSFFPTSISPFWISGGIAGACTSLLTTPVEFIKCNLQVQGQGYKGPVDVVLHTIKSKGIRGLYRGYFATTMRESPGSSLWFVVYEGTTSALVPPGQSKQDLKVWQLMFAGSMSGIAYWTAFFPADVIKTQVQTRSDGHGGRFMTTFAHIVRTRGVLGLYAGYAVTVLRAVPSNALLFASYEASKRLLTTFSL